MRLFQVFNLLETLEVSMIFIHFFVSEFNLSLKLSVHLRLSRWVKCAAFHTGIKKSVCRDCQHYFKIYSATFEPRYEDSAWEQVGRIFSQKEIA